MALGGVGGRLALHVFDNVEEKLNRGKDAALASFTMENTIRLQPAFQNKQSSLYGFGAVALERI